VKLIVGVPNVELLPYVEKKVKEYDFNYAIHLHGPDIDIYPDADDVWKHTKDLDPRIGMCLDIGHDTRNGKDPVADLEKYHSRVFDMHIKDVTGPHRLSFHGEDDPKSRLHRGLQPGARTKYGQPFYGYCRIHRLLPRGD
jgi:inosose dehydratase